MKSDIHGLVEEYGSIRTYLRQQQQAQEWVVLVRGTFAMCRGIIPGGTDAIGRNHDIDFREQNKLYKFRIEKAAGRCQCDVFESGRQQFHRVHRSKKGRAGSENCFCGYICNTIPREWARKYNAKLRFRSWGEINRESTRRR